MRRVAVLAVAALGALTAVVGPAAAGPTPSTCSPGAGPLTFSGSADPTEAKTYRLLPFEVAAGTTRVEVGYEWSDSSGLPSTPLTTSTVDLGLWDADGQGTVDGFRGWSGSRQGKVTEGQDPVFVQADAAERGYRPGPVEPGTWSVELGIAAVAPGGVDYEVTVRCLDVATGPAFAPDPVDPTHVADPDPGWYAGDFHMHGYHSTPSAPVYDDGDAGDVDSFVDHAKAAGLDFFPVTEYVTTQHHDELGPVQRANPDVVIWPGREIITYFGHATVFGETPTVVDYRHGFGDVRLGEIQAASVADGALFGVAHPTIFPGPLFANFCRGCEFTLGGDIDWGLVDTIEVVTGPILVDDSALGGPGLPVQIQNPFAEPAIELWESQLLAGHDVTAVSGSDDKPGPGLGVPATQVFAEALSRPALIEAVRAGRAYVQTRGVDASPTLDIVARGADGSVGKIGDTLPTDAATIEVRVRDGADQFLRVVRDGDLVGVVPITSDDFVHEIDARAVDGSGPLGTFWRVDTFDLQSLTAIANPVFLQPDDDGYDPPVDGPLVTPDEPTGTVGSEVDALPATGPPVGPGVVVAVLAGAAVAVLTLRSSFGLGFPDGRVGGRRRGRNRRDTGHG